MPRTHCRTALALVALSAFCSASLLADDDAGTRGCDARYIQFTGRFVYFLPTVPPTPVGVDNIRVRIMDEDSPVEDDIMAEGYTLTNGNFLLDVCWDSIDTPDIYVEFECETGVVVVENALAFDYTWNTEEDPCVDCTESFIDFGTLAPGDPNDAPALHMHNNITRAHRWIAEVAGLDVPQVNVIWPFDVNGPFYFGDILMDSAHAWAGATHVHEYGHHFMSEFMPNGHVVIPDYCNGICDDTILFNLPCGHCTWCGENNTAAWNEGWSHWLADAVTREIDATYPQGAYHAFQVNGVWTQFNNWRVERPKDCNEPGFEGWYNPINTEGFVGALLRDIEDPDVDSPADAHRADYDGDGMDDPEPACVLDALAVGPSLIFEVSVQDDPTDIVGFISAFRARYPEHAGRLWRTAYNIGRERYVPEDLTPPGAVTNLVSPSHPVPSGGTWPVIRVEWDAAPDSESGADTYDIGWCTAPQGNPFFRQQVTATYTMTGPFQAESPPVALGEYWLSIQARDCVGNVSDAIAWFGPFVVTECNGNGIVDACETFRGCIDFPAFCDSADCGTQPDCNANANPDACDIAAGASLDCNVNGVPDECESIVYWINSGGGDWSAGGNWSSGAPPGPTEHACISEDGTYTVTLDVNATVAGLTIGGTSDPDATQTLDMLSRSLTVNGPSASTIRDNGDLRTRGISHIMNAGPFAVAAGGTIRIEGSVNGANARLTLANGLTNAGVIDLTNSWGPRNAVLNVTNGTLLNLGTINSLSLPGGAGNGHTLGAEIDNQGTINIVTASCTIAKAAAQHVNRASGAINLVGEDLTINLNFGAFFANEGRIDIPSGRTLDVTLGTFNQATGGLFTGAGALALSSATANFIPDFSNAVTELLITSSTFNGPGTLTNAAARTLTLDRSTINAPFINGGTLVAHGSNCRIGSAPGLFDPADGGTIRVESSGAGNGVLTVANGFSNAGAIELIDTAVLRVTSGPLINQNTITADTSPAGGGVRALQAPLDNRGTVNIEASCTITGTTLQHLNRDTGTIRVSGGDLSLDLSGDTFTNSGAINVDAGRALSITLGSFVQTGGTISLDSGALSKTGSAIEIQGGVLRGNGTVTGVVSNTAGIVGPGLSAGAISIVGSYVQGAAGALQIELGGTSPGVEFDRLSLSGNAALDGRLRVSTLSGFEPDAADQFAFVIAGSRAGAFSDVELPPGYSGTVVYSPTAATLRLAACPGDLDGSGDVGLQDLTILLAHFGTPSGATYADGDLDTDGDVDLSDLTLLLASFGATCID